MDKDRTFRDLVARAADNAGAPLRRGMRSRNSTDGVIPSRAGYPTATLSSITAWGALANYHLPTDTPDKLDPGDVARCVATMAVYAYVLAEMPERLPRSAVAR